MGPQTPSSGTYSFSPWQGAGNSCMYLWADPLQIWSQQKRHGKWKPLWEPGPAASLMAVEPTPAEGVAAAAAAVATGPRQRQQQRRQRKPTEIEHVSWSSDDRMVRSNSESKGRRVMLYFGVGMFWSGGGMLRYCAPRGCLIGKQTYFLQCYYF